MRKADIPTRSKSRTWTSSALTGLVATILRAAGVVEKDLWAALRAFGTDFVSMAAAATDEVDDGDDGKRRLEGSLRWKTRHGGLDARPKGRHVPGDSAANHSGSISSAIGRCFGITRFVLDHIQPRREHCGQQRAASSR